MSKSQNTGRKKYRKKTVKIRTDNRTENEKQAETQARTRKQNRKSTTKNVDKLVVDTSVKAEEETLSRTSGKVFKGDKFVGAHVSVAGGLHNAVSNATEIGAQAFGMFLRNQRQWNSKPLEDKDAELFKEACKEKGYSPELIVPHGIYLVNCGSPDDETLQKSRDVLIDELKRCEKLGLAIYNFHPGSTCGKISPEESIKKIAESINMAHKETQYVITVVENMSCQGNTVS